MTLCPFLAMLLVLAANDMRYGIAPDLTAYPQGTAKETLASVLKAVESRRIDYVVAQLADPVFVDDRVRRLYGGRFEEQVTDTRGRLDPLAIKQLQRFLKDGEWQEDKDHVTVRLKDDEHRLHFKKADGRWFLKNASKLGKPQKDEPHDGTPDRPAK
jgi:hypothetical protein